MRTYLVETYLSRSSVASMPGWVAQLRALTQVAPGEPSDVRYVRSTFVPEDEVCFHVFEAISADAIRALGRQASLTFDRIVEADETDA
jgi:Nickel responsive protein SCO4226-like